MATTINADTIVGGAIITGDTSGQLALQGAGVTQVTVTNSGVTLANALPAASGGTGLTSPGANGNVLTSNGTAWTSAALSITGTGGVTASGNVTLTSSSSGAQAIATTNWGQTVTLPNATTMTKGAMVFNISNTGTYPLRVVGNTGSVLGFIYPNESASIGLADNSTAAGIWVVDGARQIAITASYQTNSVYAGTVMGRVSLDANRTLFMFQSAARANAYAQVYDASSQTWGAIATIATGTIQPGNLAFLSSSVALCIYTIGTTLYARTLSISGTTITVNSASTATTINTTYYNLSAINPGSLYVVTVLGNPAYCHAVTVSGTTTTVGAYVTVSGTTAYSVTSGGTGNAFEPYVFAVTTSSFLIFTYSTTNLNATVGSISGTTITLGSTVSTACGATVSTFNKSVIGSNWITSVQTNSAVLQIIHSVSGTTVTSNATATWGGNTEAFMMVSGNKALIISYASSTPVYFNIVTNNSGTPSLGTQVQFALGTSSSSPVPIGIFGTNALLSERGLLNGNSTYFLFTVNISGSSPVISSAQPCAYNWAANSTGNYTFTPERGTGQTRPYQLFLGSNFAMYINTDEAFGQLLTTWPNIAKQEIAPFSFRIQNGIIGANDNESWYVNNYSTTNVGWQIIRVECVS